MAFSDSIILFSSEKNFIFLFIYKCVCMCEHAHMHLGSVGVQKKISCVLDLQAQGL